MHFEVPPGMHLLAVLGSNSIIIDLELSFIPHRSAIPRLSTSSNRIALLRSTDSIYRQRESICYWTATSKASLPVLPRPVDYITEPQSLQPKQTLRASRPTRSTEYHRGNTKSRRWGRKLHNSAMGFWSSCCCGGLFSPALDFQCTCL